MCSFASDNKEIAVGYALMKMEPWKFAMGFCKARRKNKGKSRGKDVMRAIYDGSANGWDIEIVDKAIVHGKGKRKGGKGGKGKDHVRRGHYDHHGHYYKSHESEGESEGQIEV